MWDFLIVLGQIPGTDIQITFLELLCFSILLILLFLYRRRLLNIKFVSMAAVYFAKHWRLYLLVRKGTQLKLPV